MEKDNNKYILLLHRYPSIKTIKDFMEREYIYGIKPEEFFDINKELIWSQYTDADKKKYQEANKGKWPKSADDLTVDSLLPCPCNLRIQATRVTEELAISQTNWQREERDFYAFASEEISRILQDEGYQISASEKLNPKVQVFGWFKSMYYFGVDKKGNKTQLEKEISEFVDISKYIISLSTVVNVNGGSFSIRLPLINADSILTRIKNSQTDEIIGYREKATVGSGRTNQHTYRYDNEYYSKNSFGILESNYFNWLISSNDLLFISFEKLEMETEREESKKNKDSIDIKTILSNQVYDMIGLVDEVRIIADSPSSNGYVEVVGRDLMKLFLDDGSFFFNTSTCSDPSQVFANEQSYGAQGDIRDADKVGGYYNDPINRLRLASGEINVFANKTNMDLSFILKGVISQLSNIEVVPGYVFDSWGDERTTYLQLQPVKKETDK